MNNKIYHLKDTYFLKARTSLSKKKINTLKISFKFFFLKKTFFSGEKDRQTDWLEIRIISHATIKIHE